MEKTPTGAYLAGQLLGHLLLNTRKPTVQDVVTLDNGKIAITMQRGDLVATLVVNPDQLEID